MGLKASNLIAVSVDTTALELKAEANESILIRRVDYFSAAATADAFSLSVDRRKVNEYVAPSTWGVGVKVPLLNFGSLVDRLHNLGVLQPIPVASGQTFNATAPGSGNQVQVTYDLYDAGDIKATDFNGSESTDFQMFQVISNSAALAAAGDVALDQSDLDTQFPAFPAGEVVPGSRRFELLGLFGGPASDGDATDNDHYSTRLRMLKDRKDILDKALVGMLYRGNTTYTGSGVIYQAAAGAISIPKDSSGPSVYMFDTPLVFNQGTELNVFNTFAAGAGGVSVAVGEAKLGLIFNVYGT